MSPRLASPIGEVISPRVWGLLLRWAEWRSVRGNPRALAMPEEAGRWREVEGRLVFVSCGAVLEPHSTRPPRTGTMEVMNQCVMDLPEHRRAYLLAAVEREAEPWLQGESWEGWIAGLLLKERGARRRRAAVADRMRWAMAALQARAEARGLAR